MRDDWVISPEFIIRRALASRLINIEEANSRTLRNAALEEAERLRDSTGTRTSGSSTDAGSRP
jgi:hypothetical protein